jgi:hypothetical protein
MDINTPLLKLLISGEIPQCRFVDEYVMAGGSRERAMELLVSVERVERHETLLNETDVFVRNLFIQEFNRTVIDWRGEYFRRTR